MKKIYIIAGEPSGDFLGALIIEKLKQRDVEIHVIGGRLMESLGFRSCFDIAEISVGGILEIIPKIFRIKKLINLATRDILKKSVDLVLTIDSPGFCFRVARLIKKSNKKIKLIHFVAPSVWAWREKRAKKVATLFDRLLTLFDFEPKYFTKYGLQTDFVGHPAIQVFSEGQGKHDTILIMPGSRVQEVESLLPIFAEAVCNRKEKIILPTLPHLIPLVKRILGGKASNIEFETDEDAKELLFRRAKFAIVASGTATLQLALSGCPMVVCYKISDITFWILKHLVKIKHLALPNIILNKDIIPELIQDECTAENINAMIENENFGEQVYQFRLLRERLTSFGKDPSELISDILMDTIQR